MRFFLHKCKKSCTFAPVFYQNEIETAELTHNCPSADCHSNGRGAVAVLPVLATALGFTPEMQAVCLSLGVLLDDQLTAANVLCDGAVCVIVDRWAEGAKAQ